MSERNDREAVLCAALGTIQEFSTTGRLNAIEVGCMFKQDEARSTYRIASFLANDMASGRFCSVESQASHINACHGLLQVLDPVLLLHVEFLHGQAAARLPEALAALGEIDFAFLDGGGSPISNLIEFEQVARHLSPRGLIILDDVHELAPTERWPYPRPSGKGTLIVPLLALHEYLQLVHYEPVESGPSSRLGNELLGIFGSMAHRILALGAHRLLVAGPLELVESCCRRVEAEFAVAR